MKKKAVLLIILLITANNVFAQILDSNFDIIGVYLPVVYIESLERTKHNPLSWAQCSENYFHTSYTVDFFEIYANGYYDGMMRIHILELLQFRFERIGEDIYLTDHYNNRYKKLPGDLYGDEYEYESEIIGNFIGNIVLDELIRSGEIILENNLVTFPALDNKVFRIQIQIGDSLERHLHFEGVTERGNISLEIRGNEYIFYGGYRIIQTDVLWIYQVL